MGNVSGAAGGEMNIIEGGIGPAKLGGGMNAAAVAALSLGGPIIISRLQGNTGNDSNYSGQPSYSSCSDGTRSPGTPQAFDSHQEMEPYSVILPNLYLGSDVIPTSSDAVNQLNKMGVTHVLNMAIEVKYSYDQSSPSSLPSSASSSAFSYPITVKAIGIEDHPEQDVDEAIQEAVEFICKERL
jgi:hypothetical protein